MSNQRYWLSSVGREVLDFLERSGPATSMEIGEALNLDAKTRVAALRELKRRDVIRRAGTDMRTRSHRWEVIG